MNMVGAVRNAAVVAMTKSLADELGPAGVNVTVVHPGWTRTEKTDATLAEIATADAFAAINARALRNTSIWNFFDVCAISLPIRLGNALPVGLMLVGRHGEDRKLLAIAAAVEKVLGA